VICNFPIPHPGEILHSVFARYNDRMHYRAVRAASRDLFGYEKLVRPIFPNGLENLVANLPPKPNYTVTSLINDHTLLPFYELFLPRGRVSLIRNAMATDDETPISTLLGLRNRILPTKCNCFCPCCIKDDREQFGECYWHRVHQLPGVEVCPSHNVYLQYCTLYANEATHAYEYVSAEKAISRLKNDPIGIKNSQYNDFLKIACDALWLLQNHDVTVDLSSVQKRLLILLAEKGFATYRGNLYTNKLLQSFRQFYPTNFLEQLHCELYETTHRNWLANLPHGKENVYGPTRHLLLIYFLGYRIETFLNLPIDQKPFGDGPWPCLNPVCNNYYKRCIQECEVIYLPAYGRYPRGRFSCECGFTYSRIGPDHTEKDQFRASKFKLYGPLWEQKLREIWKDPTINISQAAHILGVGQKVFKDQAKKFGLIVIRSLRRDVPVQKVEDSRTYVVRITDPVLLEKNRTIWLAEQVKTANISVKELKSKVPKIHRWLYSHDREWLLSNSPKPFRQGTSGPKPLQVLDQRDTQFATEVRSSALSIIHTHGSPTRLTKASISNSINQKSMILRNLDRLPLTAQTLTEFSETPEMFAIRRVQWLVGCYQQEGVCPTRGQFLSRGNLRSVQARWVSVKNAIDDALRHLNTIMA